MLCLFYIVQDVLYIYAILRRNPIVIFTSMFRIGAIPLIRYLKVCGVNPRDIDILKTVPVVFAQKEIPLAKVVSSLP